MKFHANVFEARFEGEENKVLIITQQGHLESVLKAYVNQAGYAITNGAKEHAEGRISAFVVDNNGGTGKLIVEEMLPDRVVLL